MKTLKLIQLFTMAIVYLLLSSASLSAVELFVSETGSDITGDGSISFPYGSIGFAADQAINGDTITVMPGVYEGETYVSLNLYIRSQQGPEVTVLHTGSGTSSSFYFDDVTDTATIEGFTLEGSSCSTVDVNNSLVNVVKCDFKECGGDECNGGAINAYYSSITIHECLFLRCSSYSSDGAISLYNTSARIFNCVFDSNYVDESYGTVGAISVEGEDTSSLRVIIQNNIFMQNTALETGALYIGHSNVHVYNNFFHANVSTDYGAAITVAYGTNPYVYNNIFTYNSQMAVYSSNPAVWQNYGNNDYYANYPTSGCPTCPEKPYIYYLDPKVIDLWGGDFHLTDSSGLINIGANNLPYSYDFDFEKNPRISGNVTDLGPFEFVDCSLSGDFEVYGDSGGCVGTEIAFTAINLEGFYDSIRWDYGDGYYEYGLITPVHEYTTTGEFDVSLSLITACTTMTVTKPSLVNIYNAPVADFSADDTAGCFPFTVEFQSDISEPVEEYLWDFGDGATSTEANPSHTYDSSDVFDVRLIATNRCGTDTIFKPGYIGIVANVIADFEVDSAEGSVPLTVNFLDKSLNDPIGWEWLIEGSIVKYNTQNAEHRFLFPGEYDVTLVTWNECEIPDTISIQDLIKVHGFKLAQLDKDSSQYSYRFTFMIDSLYGEYDSLVSLQVSLRNQPAQGEVILKLSKTQAELYDTVYLDVDLDKAVPIGDYEIELIASGASSFYKDSSLLTVTSDPDQILAVDPGMLDFGEVPEDSTKNMILSIENTLEFPDTFTLRILSINSSDDQFTTDFSGTQNIIVGNEAPITVSFTPADTGTFSALLTVTSNDPVSPSLSYVLSGQGVVERTPPVVDSTTPNNGEIEFSVTEDAVIYFSEPILSSAIGENTITAVSFESGSSISGTITHDTEENSLTFSPLEDFPTGDSITITVKGDIVDLVGNSLDGDNDGQGSGSPDDDYIFSFTTGFAVYPGDANNDGIVNEMDVLPLGVYWDNTGPARGFSTIWTKQSSKIWFPQRATYADCNGDGKVDMSDLSVIGTNWGLTHDVVGSPVIFSSEELKGATEQFNVIYSSIDSDQMGDVGTKIQNLLSDFVTSPTVPGTYYLGSNFPNPFNPTTTIDFSVPSECHVHLEVYNVLGQTVKVLVDNVLSKGFHTVSWNGTDYDGREVPSGVYFYRMNAHEFNQVKKMILVR